MYKTHKNREFKGTVLNIDNDALYHFARRRDFKITDLEKEIAEHFNERYLNAGLSDILYNIDGASPCRTREFCGDRYLRKEERGVAVDYSANKKLWASHEIYSKYDVDPFAVWIDMCRENGINPWISFRMNDVHYANSPTGHSEFFYTAKEKGWLIGERASQRWGHVGSSFPWYGNAFNYAIPEVRQHFLDYIDEMLERHDVYGIELDWQRVIWCFRFDSAENCVYMNDFMAKVNAIVAKYEERYGHKIKIMVRINRDIDENIFLGFDVREWVKRDYIDVIVASPYWGSTDSDMPIAKWKRELEGTGIEVYAGLEMHTTHWLYNQTRETLAAQAAMYLGAGADKIYLFNFMECEQDYWTICSSLDAAMSHPVRRYVVTPSNCAPDGVQRYVPLPMALLAGESGEITLNYGPLDTDGRTILYVGVDNARMMPEVVFNGCKLECMGESNDSYYGEGNKPYPIFAYNVPKEALGEKAHMRFCVPGTTVIRYAELMNTKT